MKKNFILTAIATVAVVVAGVFSAFKSVPQKAQLQEQWFEYNGSGSQFEAENYSPSSTQNPDCGGSQRVCAIKAMEDENGHPEISSGLVTEINNALATPSVPQANVRLQNN